MATEILAFEGARGSTQDPPCFASAGFNMPAAGDIEASAMSEKPEPGSIPAELVGHDAETADLLGSLSEGLAPDEDPLYVNLARRDAEKPPPRPMHEAEAPVYVDPKTPPERTKTKTLELETVRVDEPAADDPRRMPTQREIAVPRDALESEERRAPTQRKLRKPPVPERDETEDLAPPMRKSKAAFWIAAAAILVAIAVALTMFRNPTSQAPATTEAPVAATTSAGTVAPPAATSVTPQTTANGSPSVASPVSTAAGSSRPKVSAPAGSTAPSAQSTTNTNPFKPVY